MPAADDALPLPLDAAVELRGQRAVYCRAGCRHLLTSRASIARGYGPACWAQVYGGTAPRPGGWVIEQDALPGV